MRVAISGNLQHFDRPPRLLELLQASLGCEAPAGVAVAVNGEVVRRATWPEVILADGDQVEIVKATQGG